MSTIVTRAGKGSILTNTEMDANFTNLNNDKIQVSTITGTAGKTTPVDADLVTIVDSVGTVLNKVTWANAKATLKTYFDTVHAALAGSVSQVFSVASLELGHASDTTITRVSAGVAAVEGATIVTTAPGTSGNILTSNGSAWTSAAPASTGLPRSYLAGLTLSNNGTDATNDIDIAVGTCRDSTNTVDITLASALTKRLDATWAVGTNQGGLDTGAIANGTYHMWVIRRSDTSVVDVLFSTSATSPTMPANYDTKRRIGSILRESGAIVSFKQNGNSFRRSIPISDLDATGMSGTATSRTLSVPIGIQVLAEMNVHLDNETTAGRIVLLMTSLDEADTTPSYTVFTLIAGDNSAGRKPVCAYEVIKTNTSAQIRTRFDFATAGTDRLKITTLGWNDSRGRDD